MDIRRKEKMNGKSSLSKNHVNVIKKTVDVNNGYLPHLHLVIFLSSFHSENRPAVPILV
jgi:hypothetical protein